MKKQYRCVYESWWKTRLYIYDNGFLIENKTYPNDEIENVIDQLETDGYVYGYTKEEVERAKKKYEDMLENIIEGKR